jgi:hypothetical protein
MQIVFCFSLCLLLQTKCRLCFQSSSNRRADISTPIATMDSSSGGQMTSAWPSLLGAIVATGVFGLSLLSYHCSNGSVAHGHSDLRSIATMPDRSSAFYLFRGIIMLCFSLTFSKIYVLERWLLYQFNIIFHAMYGIYPKGTVIFYQSALLSVMRLI